MKAPVLTREGYARRQVLVATLPSWLVDLGVRFRDKLSDRALEDLPRGGLPSLRLAAAARLRGSASRISVWLRLRRPRLSPKFVNEE